MGWLKLAAKAVQAAVSDVQVDTQVDVAKRKLKLKGTYKVLGKKHTATLVF
jgi:hypothetical protein